MISSILKNVCINNGDQFTLPAIPKNWIEIEFVNEQQQQLQHNNQQTHSQMKTVLPFSNSECFTVSKYNGKLLTLSGCDDVKEVYELNLDVSELPINSYLPGDTIGILPENSSNDVNIIIQQLGYGKICDQNYRMMLRKNCEKKNAKLPIYLVPENCSIRKLIKDSLDIHCVPKKLLLLSLINYIDDPLEQNFLKLLCSKEGTAIYTNEILMKGITFLELIKNVQTCRPPFHILLEHLPRLMPRVYSIANWQNQQQHSKQNQLKIVFSINYKNPGITTSMLKQYIIDTTTTTTTTTTTNAMAIYFYFRIQNKFQYNYLEMKNSINSIIMIATGTGIAPFLSFLEYRKYQQQQQQQQNEVNSAWLIYGCRYKLKNYLYSDMLQQYLTESNVLTELSTVFSKDRGNLKEVHCKYVQHLIEKDSKKFMEFYLNENCKIYICGAPEMISDVNKTIIKLLTTTTEQCSIEDAQMMITKKKLNGNHIEDVWK